MPTARTAAEQIKQLYFAATKATIAADLERAIELLISLDSDEARERVAVYMDGLSQMRSEWGAAPKAAAAGTAPGKTAGARSARSATKRPAATATRAAGTRRR